MFLAAVLVSLLAACASSGPVQRSTADLINPALGPDYSQWLVGPIARLATPQEVQGYLAVTDDTGAEKFIADFWQRRDPSPDRPGNAILEAFEQRSEGADRRFSEASYLGRRTARGEIYIVYGAPTKIDHEVSPREGGPPIEVWIYESSAPSGLDGRRPASFYRFIKRGDLTVFYFPGSAQDRLPSRPTLPRYR